MTFPIPSSESRPGARRRPAVNYGDLGYDPEDLPMPPAAATAPVPVVPRVVPEPAVMPPVASPAAAVLPDPGLISPDPAVSEEEQWWAGQDIDEPDEDRAGATPAVRSPMRRRPPRAGAAAVGVRGSGVRLVRRVFGLNRPKGAASSRTAGAGSGSSDGSAPGWLSDLDTAGEEAAGAGDPTARGAQHAAAGDGPARSPHRVSRPTQDLEVSRAPRELGATVRRGLIGLVLLLIAFAGVKQVLWNPLFGRTTGTAATGPAGMDQVAADGAATRYALDYLSYSPAGAGAAAAAVTADVVSGDAAPQRWAGTGYLHADTALPGSWHVLNASHAVVSVTVRVHLAMPPSTQATTITTTPSTPAVAAPPSSAAAPPTAPKPTPTSIPTAAKPGTAAKRPGPVKTTAAAKRTTAAPVAPSSASAAKSSTATSPAAISAPALETTAEVGTAAVPPGPASDPGAIPAGWTDLGSRWLTLAVPVQTSGGVVKVSASGAVLSGEAPTLVTSDTAWKVDPATATATHSVATSFFGAYAQSNVAYLAEPGVDLAGLGGTVTPVAVTGWNVSVPPAPVSGSAAAASSAVGSAAVTWQLAGTDLQIQQSYSIALTNSQNRWYIAALSPVLSTTAQ